MKIGGCEYPDRLLYDVESGTWARKEGNLYRLGIAPQLNWISGGYTSVSFKDVGDRVALGKRLGSVEGPKHFDNVRAPFESVIRGTNQAVLTDPKLINREAYGDGWFVLLEYSGGPSALRTLSAASGLIQARLKELGVRCFAEFPDFEMFEIGVECSAVLVKLNDLLATSPPRTVVHLVSDDPTADVEMERWRLQTGNLVLGSSREENLYHFVVKKK